MNLPKLNTSPVFWSCLLVLAFFIIAYSGTLMVLSVIWSGVESAGYSHGFLVLGCSIYLLYLKKDEFLAHSPRPNYWALLPLSGFSLLWFVAMVSGVQTVQLAVLPLLLLFAIALLLGNQFFKIAFIPIMLIFFALPVWDLLLPSLQEITTQTAHFNLKLVGRPIFVQGNELHLPGGTFLVETSCSGLRFLLVSTTLSLMYSSMHELSLKQGTLLLGITIFLSLIANWVRVLVVVLAGDYTNMQSSLVDDHANLGWAIFLVLVLVPFFLVTKYFTSPQPSSLEGDHVLKNKQSQQSKTKVFAILSLTCCALLIGPVLYQTLGQQELDESRVVSVPSPISPWTSPALVSNSVEFAWRPFFTGGSNELYAEYVDKQSKVELHVIYYGIQNQNAELINVENQLTDDEQWFVVRGSEDAISLDLDNGTKLSLLSAEVRSRQGQHKKVWYWYNVGGENTIIPYKAKLLQVTSLLRHRTDASLLALAIDCELNCNDADILLRSYLDIMYPAIIKIF